MKTRCPEAEVYGTSMIYGYRLLFKKSMTGFYATIEQDANSAVPVVIYRISPYDEARLDRFEGFPKYYYKREFFLPIWNLDGRRRKKRRSSCTKKLGVVWNRCCYIHLCLFCDRLHDWHEFRGKKLF